MNQSGFIYGGDYNPEQWLAMPEILEQDIEYMKEAHINEVTLGVFSWSVLEPEEGVYHLEWLEKIMDQLYKNEISVILSTPSAAPTTAPKLGASLSDPIKMYLGDIYTISVNLAGLPGISIPVGQDAKGLPVGMQLIGDCFQEKKLFQAAYTYECLTEKKWVSMYDKTEAAGKEEA